MEGSESGSGSGRAGPVAVREAPPYGARRDPVFSLHLWFSGVGCTETVLCGVFLLVESGVFGSNFGLDFFGGFFIGLGDS